MKIFHLDWRLMPLSACTPRDKKTVDLTESLSEYKRTNVAVDWTNIWYWCNEEIQSTRIFRFTERVYGRCNKEIQSAQATKKAFVYSSRGFSSIDCFLFSAYTRLENTRGEYRRSRVKFRVDIRVIRRFGSRAVHLVCRSFSPRCNLA